MILNNYNETCAISGINDTRLNPENGICLSALYNRAFDNGLITIRPNDYSVMVSKELKDKLTQAIYEEYFGKVENQRIIMPEEHKPNSSFLQYHVENVFVK